MSELCGTILNAALKFSVEPAEIVPSETDPWEIALLNITNCPESVLILLCLEGYLSDAMIEMSKKFGLNHEQIQSLAKSNASFIPKGDALLLHQLDRPSIEDSIFSISVKQYYWAHQLLEASKDFFV
jgi:hypothetical protein